MKKQVSPKIVAIVFAVLVVCFAIAVYVSAQWTEPSSAPPTGNVYPPLNVSGTGQAKAGGLVIHSSSSFEDPANPNALLIPYGNVGIGTTTPSAKLEVAGQVKITGGTPGAGKVLTSDVNGFASWQAVTDVVGFGAWIARSNNTVYQAATDGFVFAYSALDFNIDIQCLTDSFNPPTTIRQRSQRVVNEGTNMVILNISCAVKKNDFWKVIGASTVYWIPLGS